MKKLGTIVILSFFSLLLYAQNNPTVELTTPNASADIMWVEKVYDFGEIEHRKPVTAVYEFKNTGNAPLIINNVVASCGCTATDYPKAPVAPGMTANIKAVFDAKSKGAFNKTVTIFTNAPEGRSTLVLKGKVL